MGEAVKDNHALVATAQENMLDKLKESNVLLEEIQKGLNDYLEKKRLYFPRWAWTSGPIITKYRSPHDFVHGTGVGPCMCPPFHQNLLTLIAAKTY